ncbi:MAG: CHASE2 domain-containing protein [Bdellovibrionales bacterium]|nr:CHASE2 domain-containing protein [Bdellovibrionales bacterium]
MTPLGVGFVVLEIRLHKNAGEEDSRQSRLFSHLSASFLAALFVIGVSQFELDGLNGILIDAQFRSIFWKRPHPAIALVAYDDKSSNRYYGSPKIPVVEIEKVLGALEVEKPKAVAFIGSINERIYSPEEMTAIAAAFKRLPQTLVGYIDDESFGKVQTNPYLPETTFLPAFISRDNFSYGADSVTRRAMITIGGLPTVYAELARLYRGQADIPNFQHAHRYADTGPLQLYINWQGPSGTYPLHPSQDLAAHRFSPGTFTDKIVLFGSALLARQSADFILTPYDRSPMGTTLLEGAAQTLGTLLDDNAIHKSPPWFNWLLSLVIGVITVNMVLLFSPVRGILSVVSEIAFLFLFSLVSLTLFNRWVDVAHPFIVACFGYYLVIPYRLVNEYRQRWHYQQKTEIMSELEQLKSNFLSLVSHDLKTPIARIQGNAELLLNEASPKTPKETKILSAIVNTTENLSQHVEAILDLTRIESSQMPLNKASKDINATIIEVVESKQGMASDKEIKIQTRLEPIFSFKFDLRLIRRVIANLIENAIKYSPAGSTITVLSKEENGWIRVSVEDQGPGIAPEEQERVFSKFYRGQSPLTHQEKGTGLGLYLVKYFVELHKGFVDLKSELGKGSTFTVSLPI